MQKRDKRDDISMLDGKSQANLKFKLQTFLVILGAGDLCI